MSSRTLVAAGSPLVVTLSFLACGGPQAPATTTGGPTASTTGSTATAKGSESGPSAISSTSTGSTGPMPVASAAPKADPIDPAVPDAKDLKPFSRRLVCEKPPCPSQFVPAGADLGPDGKPVPLVMFEVVLGRKVMWSVPKNASLTLHGALLDGEVSVMADDIKEKQKRCWRLDAFRAPGGGVNVYAKEPTRILVGVSVNGDVKSVTDALGKPVPWAKRASPVESLEFGKKPVLSWGDGAYHARIGFEDAGTPSLTLLLMSKNAPVAEHVHAGEWELLAILEGEGELLRKDGNVKVAPGTFVAIPPGVAHGYRPSGNAPTFAVQMYTPPGPEQRFKKLGEKKP